MESVPRLFGFRTTHPDLRPVNSNGRNVKLRLLQPGEFLELSPVLKSILFGSFEDLG